MVPTVWPPSLSWSNIKGAVSAVQTTVAFTVGVANDFGSSMLMNAGRGDAAADFPNNAAAASDGQMVGDAATVVVGAVETALGVVATAGGGTATVATGGAASSVSLPVAAGGLAAAAHGASAVTTGMQNLMAKGDSNQGSGTGRGSNNRQPDSSAGGDHSTLEVMSAKKANSRACDLRDDKNLSSTSQISTPWC